MKTSSEIRQMFLDYFVARGHEMVASSPLVPGNDPTLLFTNAGMVQFKDVFLGRDKRSYRRAVTSQRCVRAGGKHNDLENVGYTARHHTFFEMLGNFSFGDYFKQDAIKFCWELLTKEYGLAPEKLWVTVYDKDQEAEDIWFNEIGIDRSRFSRCGEKDNFWSMGDTGPCGPCSEVFYDHGPEIWGGPPGSPEEDGDRYIEIWNLVFMQYDRAADGTLKPLPKPSVDTGMGLERLAAVLQGVHSNYETDLFVNLINAAAEVTQAADRNDKSLRVIADHIRSCAFMIVDGVIPDKEGRGYVLRRIIRRAIRHGHKLGTRDPFFYRLVSTLDNEMGEAYPELRERREIVERVIKTEEERFAETLDNGMRILDEAIDQLQGTVIPGEVAFKLYDTYGFPADLTADIARERNLSVDMDRFDLAMKAQQSRSRDEGAFEAESIESLNLEGRSEFDGYDTLSEESTVVAIRVDGESVERIGIEDRAMVVLDRTPFYAESGGQIGDRGLLKDGQAVFEVEDTRRVGELIVHVGVVTEGNLSVGARVAASVDVQARRSTARNHSATHLLHAALRKILGTHVTQKGSLVNPERLRFDFSHYEPVTQEQLEAIENQVNEWVQSNDEACTRVMALDDARKSGAIALFGEKYEDPVRVLSIGSYSTELCGGTHVARGGDIGLFKLVGESGIAAGIRRIEAVTGMGALRLVQDSERRLRSVANSVKAERDNVGDKIEQILARNRELEKDLERLRARMAASQGEDLAAQAIDIAGIKVLAAQVDGVDSKRLRDTVDQLKNKLGSAAILLATVDQDKVKLVAGVTKDCTDRIKAGPLAKFVAEQVGGGGGGRPDMAEAGGSDPSRLGQAISSVPNWVRAQLGL